MISKKKCSKEDASCFFSNSIFQINDLGPREKFVVKEPSSFIHLKVSTRVLDLKFTGWWFILLEANLVGDPYRFPRFPDSAGGRVGCSPL